MERDDQVGGGTPAERGDLLDGARGTPAAHGHPQAPREETTIRVSGSTPGGPAPGTPPAVEGEAERIARERTAPGSVRAEDTEPYIGLQYIARLFKIVSFLVLIALGLEMLLGIASDGASAILPLFAEIVQGGVLAAILWGAADVVLLLIDLGHDVRAERVLLGRISARGEQQYGGGQRKRERER